MAEWPYDRIFQNPPEGVVQQELITYRVLRGKITKERITRKYYQNSDYQDSVSTEVLNVNEG